MDQYNSPMNRYRFILEPYSSKKSRFRCPSCGRAYAFTRYIDLEKKEYVAEHVGKCNRIQKCNYHYPPKRFFEDQKIFTKASAASPVPRKPRNIPAPGRPVEVTYMEELHVTRSTAPGLQNNFLEFLGTLMDPQSVENVRSTYRIGTGTHWKGSTIFWQIDQHHRVRTGKVMQYNRLSGRKGKVNWMHSILRLNDFHLQQCLFGLHLLNTDPHKPIGIVESEKTAIIASLAFPEFIWMATGGLLNLKFEMFTPLAGRKVTLFPDAGCFSIWKEKRRDLPGEMDIHISEKLENRASAKEKTEGYDLADYIVPVWKNRKNI